MLDDRAMPKENNPILMSNRYPMIRYTENLAVTAPMFDISQRVHGHWKDIKLFILNPDSKSKLNPMACIHTIHPP